LANTAGDPALRWRIQRDISGRFLLYETAFCGGLVLFVSGMRRDWGLMLSPPQPDLPETWSWRVERPGGPTLASGKGLASRHAAERAAVDAALAMEGANDA
jgi:hypothetical protein